MSIPLFCFLMPFSFQYSSKSIKRFLFQDEGQNKRKSLCVAYVFIFENGKFLLNGQLSSNMNMDNASVHGVGGEGGSLAQEHYSAHKDRKKRQRNKEENWEGE